MWKHFCPLLVSNPGCMYTLHHLPKLVILSSQLAQSPSEGCFFLVVVVLLFRAEPVAYGGSQARGWIRAVACRPTPQLQQHGMQALSATYTTAHGNAGSPTHWSRPGIESASSWMLVRFVNHWAMTGTPQLFFKFNFNFIREYSWFTILY